MNIWGFSMFLLRSKTLSVPCHFIHFLNMGFLLHNLKLHLSPCSNQEQHSEDPSRLPDASISKSNSNQQDRFNQILDAYCLGYRLKILILQQASDLQTLGVSSSAAGKTFVTTAAQHFLKSWGKHILAVASSAIATQFLDRGRTRHRAL